MIDRYLVAACISWLKLRISPTGSAENKCGAIQSVVNMLTRKIAVTRSQQPFSDKRTITPALNIMTSFRSDIFKGTTLLLLTILHYRSVPAFSRVAVVSLDKSALGILNHWINHQSGNPAFAGRPHRYSCRNLLLRIRRETVIVDAERPIHTIKRPVGKNSK